MVGNGKHQHRSHLVALTFCLLCCSASKISETKSERQGTGGVGGYHGNTLGETKVDDRFKRSVFTPFSLREREHYLNMQNEFRKAAPAANMIKLRWNEDLESLAYTTIDECRIPNSTESFHFQDFNSIGQNFARADDVLRNLTQTINSWHSEEKEFVSADEGICMSDAGCHNYVQLVWAKSIWVGCSERRCENVTGPKGQSKGPAKLFICLYSPAADLVTNDPFIPGTPCSKCPTKYRKCPDAICVYGKGDSSNAQHTKPYAILITLSSIAMLVLYSIDFWLPCLLA